LLEPGDSLQAVRRLRIFGLTKVKLPKQLHLCNVIASLLARGACLESQPA
jgi:hypothetical protein